MARLAPATKTHTYDLMQLIGKLTLGVPLDGKEAEQAQQMAREVGMPYDATKPRVPFTAFFPNRTTLMAGTSNAAGFLVETDTMTLVEALRALSLAVQAGCTEQPGLQGNVAYPREGALSTVYWQSNELSVAPTSAPTFGQIYFTPKICIGVIEVSRQLLLQSPTIAGFIRRELLKTAAAAVDTAVLAGTGALGQPQGVIGPAPTISGTSFSYASALSMKATLAQANVNDSSISFIGNPGVRQLLESRQRFASTNSAIWDADQIAAKRAMVSTLVPAGTLVAADWSQITIASWGNGFELEVNPYDAQGFQVGKVQIRIYLAIDVGVMHPNAIIVANNIT